MFDPEFYPTSHAAWEAMNPDCYGKIVLDPSAGKGDILKYATESGAHEAFGIEKNPELFRLLASKYQTKGKDWFTSTPEDIASVQMIIMNPPFSNADDHILHAWNIAPEGCEIIAQCNVETIDNQYTRKRKELAVLIKDYGTRETFSDLYKDAERKTNVQVAVIRLFKPVSVENVEFDGFYYDMPSTQSVDGLIKYNEIQALVNNYVGAVRCFDRFEEVGGELNNICKQMEFGTNGGFAFNASYKDGAITSKLTFARELQKKCWKNVFKKFDLEKYLTKQVMENVNKFVESRLNYPFTMKNIFRMVEIIVGTSGENMEKAVVEAVDNFTRHTHENRFLIEGWKTNSGHMLNRRFIVGLIAEQSYSGGTVQVREYFGNFEYIRDLSKALCFLTGKDFNKMKK